MTAVIACIWQLWSEK